MTAAIETRVCANPNCDNELVRRSKETPASFEDRKFCSIPCTRQRIDLGERRCANATCRAVLERRQRENSADWRSRRYCRASCYRPPTASATARPVLPPRRWCGAPGCGLELTRRQGECGADFRKRRFCGRDCSNAAVGKPQSTPLAVPLRHDRTDWSKAACRDQDDVAWWTDTGRDWEEEARLRELARWYCASCPLMEACRQRGQTEQFGLFGGELWRVVEGRRVSVDLLAPVVKAAAS